jgi:hypothetical protein
MSKQPIDESARTAARIAQIKRVIAQRGLTGLANDTKWNEFIVGIRTLFGMGGNAREWRPSYRFKMVDREPSEWDIEWWYHLPNFLPIEWFDVAHLQGIPDKSRPHTTQTVDHAPRIAELLERVGLEFEVGTTMIRVFGYAPKSQELFDT